MLMTMRADRRRREEERRAKLPRCESCGQILPDEPSSAKDVATGITVLVIGVLVMYVSLIGFVVYLKL
jgi:uncharacterized protein (DUF983 family)